MKSEIKPLSITPSHYGRSQTECLVKQTEATGHWTLDSIFYAHLLTSWAGFLDDFRKENTELRAQLVAFQKAANPAVAVDPASGLDTTAWYTPFVRGARVCLKVHPYQRGTIVNTRFDDRRGYLISVRFESDFESDRWVKAKNLELIPDE